MAKRNKAKFAAKSRKSALRVEALEQRQLLAAVTGGGTEVGSNIVHPNGNVYDQVLMTGASVTVTADAGQVTRVSFLDLSGDIVQAEFSGAGSLTISLDQFKAATEAPTYNQPGIKYVQGLATFTIQGENSTTNFSAFSVGSGNAINQSLFAAGKTGGNHLADVARLLIVADPAQPNGSTMGGIRMGNVVFADTAGVVGISGANVQTQGPVIIGDIDASNAGVPTLKFGTSSQFATLTVAGGDLVQTNGQTFAGNITGFSSLNSTAGADSTVESRPGFTLGAPNLTSKVVAGATVPGITVVTLDSTASFDLTGKSQADIDAAFKGRTFTSDITINGDLSGVNSLSAAEFRGAVTFAGTLSGDVTVSGAIKSLTLSKTNSNNISADSIGAVTATANLGGTVKAKSIGSVTVGGDLTGAVSTDVGATAGRYDSGEKAIGNVNITGNASGSLYGVLGIGNVSVGGDLTTTGSTFLRTSSGSSGDAFVANIGTVTVNGDARQLSTDGFISISAAGGGIAAGEGNGTFGAVTIKGAGTDTSAHALGTITVGRVLGAAGTATGAISITDDAAVTTGAIAIGNSSNNGSMGALSVKSTGGNVSVGTVTFTGTGSVGDINLTGSGAKNSKATLDVVSATTGSAGATLGNITLAGAEGLEVKGASGKAIGNISATSASNGGSIFAKITGAVTANNGTNTGTIGNITLNAVSGKGTATLGGDITTSGGVTATDTSSIGTLTLTGKTVSITNNVQATKIGAVSLTGTTTFSADKGFQALGGLASVTVVGDTTFNSTTTANIRTGGTTGMPLSITGVTTATASTVANVAADDGTSNPDALGALTFNGQFIGAGTGLLFARASSIGDINVTGSLTTGQSLVKNLNVYAGNNGSATKAAAEVVKTDGSNLSAYSVGNVTVTSTNTIGITGTALFDGSNTINAIGKIGNVNFSAGGSAAVQSTLFAATGTPGLVIQTGNGNVSANKVNTLSSGIDFDGNGTMGNGGATVTVHDSNVTGAIETGSTFSTSATVSIGSITVNAAAKAGATDSIGGVGGNDTTTFTDGLVILSGVQSGGTDYKPSSYSTTAAAAGKLAAINSNLRGTVGNMSFVNLNQQLSIQPNAGTGPAYANPTSGTTTIDYGAVIAATAGTSTSSPYGTIQGIVSSTAGLDAAAKTVIIGKETADTGTAAEIVVIRL